MIATGAYADNVSSLDRCWVPCASPVIKPPVTVHTASVVSPAHHWNATVRVVSPCRWKTASIISPAHHGARSSPERQNSAPTSLGAHLVPPTKRQVRATSPHSGPAFGSLSTIREDSCVSTVSPLTVRTSLSFPMTNDVNISYCSSISSNARSGAPADGTQKAGRQRDYSGRLAPWQQILVSGFCVLLFVNVLGLVPWSFAVRKAREADLYRAKLINDDTLDFRVRLKLVALINAAVEKSGASITKSYVWLGVWIAMIAVLFVAYIFGPIFYSMVSK